MQIGPKRSWPTAYFFVTAARRPDRAEALGVGVERCFSKDELLTNVMIYWATATVGSALLPYYDFASAGAMTWIGSLSYHRAGSRRITRSVTSSTALRVYASGKYWPLRHSGARSR
jgi:hypothetical protein